MRSQMTSFACQAKDHRLYSKNEEPQKNFEQERCGQRYDMKYIKITLAAVQRIDGVGIKWEHSNSQEHTEKHKLLWTGDDGWSREKWKDSRSIKEANTIQWTTGVSGVKMAMERRGSRRSPDCRLQ